MTAAGTINGGASTSRSCASRDIASGAVGDFSMPARDAD
jgi:hypothetical protein